MTNTVFCTLCGIAEVPAPKNMEEDPICKGCEYILAARERDADPNFSTATYEFNNDEGGCPGYGDSCGNDLEGDADLCGDCHSARLDAESPRIPR